MTLGDYIRDNGLRRPFVAERVEISPQYLNMLLRGERSPSLKVIARVHSYTGGQVTLRDWHPELEAS